MKVLIIHQHFKTPQSGGAIRSYYLAKGLLDHGHKVVVITAHNDNSYQHTTYEGIEIHYLPVPYDNAYNYYQRGMSFLRFVTQSIRKASDVTDVDRIYAISVPLTVALIARWTSFRRKVPYLFEVGDLWPDAPIQMGFVTGAITKSILYSMERGAYRNAAGVVALSPSIRDAVVRKVPGTKVAMVPNMADCDFYHPTSKDPELIRKFNVEGKFVVSYIGATGLANGLDHLLDFANASRQSQLPVHFIVCGTGALLERLKSSATTLGLQNITFTGFVDREGVRGVMNITDAVFVCYKQLPILETGSPNKFFDGLAAGKLIIINFGGWIQQEIEQASCGFRVHTSNPLTFVEKVRKVIDNPSQLGEYQKNARDLAERKFSRTKLIPEWVKFVSQVR